MRGWVLLMTLGSVMLALGGSIQLKAVAAQWMLDYAWQSTLRHHQQQKPWPWADTWPVAKLQLDSTEAMIVLEGVSGQALAFGPGRMQEHNSELIVVAGHRDTHFSSLKKLVIGDEISLQEIDGQWRTYHVSEIEIVDTQTHMIDLSVNESARPQLLLVTCYPFETVQAGGPLRYVVTATESA